jgi:hypothetical protein
MRVRLVTLLTALLAFVFIASPASAATKIVITATETGTSALTPQNGTLYIYSDEIALHHTRSVQYYMHDGYNKTANLKTRANPLGVILRSEDIENNCASSGNPGALNPPGGTGLPCMPVLHKTPPVPYPVTGDLAGRYCRVPPPGHTGSCPFTVHRTENATGTGQYLTVGGKDHGALQEVDYYVNIGGVNKEVDVILPVYPDSKAVLITRILLEPTSTPTTPDSAVIVLNS